MYCHEIALPHPSPGPKEAWRPTKWKSPPELVAPELRDKGTSCAGQECVAWVHVAWNDDLGTSQKRRLIPSTHSQPWTEEEKAQKQINRSKLEICVPQLSNIMEYCIFGRVWYHLNGIMPPQHDDQPGWAQLTSLRSTRTEKGLKSLMTSAKHETQNYRQNKKETNKTSIAHPSLCLIPQVSLRLCRHTWIALLNIHGLIIPTIIFATHGLGIFMQSMPFLISKSWNFLESTKFCQLQTPNSP